MSPKETVRFLHDKGFFHLLSVNFLNQFLGFGTSLLVARLLSPQEFGEIKILQSYTAVFVLMAGMGFNTALLKYASERRGEKEKTSLLRAAAGGSLVAAVCTLVLFALLSLFGVLTAAPGLSRWLALYGFVMPFWVMTDLLIAHLQAQKKIQDMAKAQFRIKLQSFTLITLATWFFGFQGFVVATLLAYAAGLWPLLSQTGLNFIRARAAAYPKGFLGMAALSAAANGVTNLGQYLDIMALDHWTTDRVTIGYYSLATLFFMAARQVTGTAQSIVLPYFSARSKDEQWLRHQLFKNQVRAVLLSLAIAPAVYFAAWVLTHNFYKPGSEAALPYLAILLLRYVFWSSYSVLAMAILSLGYVHYNLITDVVATLAGALLTFFWLKDYGTIGVAWAQAALALLHLPMFLFFTWLSFKKSFRGKLKAYPAGE